MILKEKFRVTVNGRDYLVIGYGSDFLREAARDRLGDGEHFLMLIKDRWESGHGDSEAILYAIRYNDYHIFNAYGGLPEGYSLVGWGDDSMSDGGADYREYVPNLGEWAEQKGRVTQLYCDVIYAIKEEPKGYFWDCDCDHHFIHPSSTLQCPLCKAFEIEAAESKELDILKPENHFSSRKQYLFHVKHSHDLTERNFIWVRYSAEEPTTYDIEKAICDNLDAIGKPHVGTQSQYYKVIKTNDRIHYGK